MFSFPGGTSVSPTLLAESGRAELAAESEAARQELVSVGAVGLQGKWAASRRQLSQVSVVALICLSLALRAALTGSPRESVLCVWVTVPAMSETQQVAAGVLRLGYWLQMIGGSDTVGVSAPVLQDVVEVHPCRDRTNPKSVREPMSGLGLDFPVFPPREDAIATTPCVDPPCPSPAPQGGGLVDVAQETRLNTESIRVSLAGGQRIAVFQPSFVVAVAPYAGVAGLLAAFYCALFHDLRILHISRRSGCL